MASLTQPQPAPLAAVNEGIEAFLQRIERAANAPVHVWFTLAEAKAIGALLNRGESLLHHSLSFDAGERSRYAANLARLLQAFRAIQSQLQQFCYLVTSQRQHVAAVSSWLASQRTLGTP